MELIKGQPLDDWLEMRYVERNGVAFRESKPIVKQLADGMAFVHEKGIAHRDLKPSNLVFDEATEKLVIVDFGLSKQFNSNSTITGANDNIGTLLYMSPEQLDGEITSTSYETDVWSIGVIWHEILTHHTPFERSALDKNAGSSAYSSAHSSASRSKRRTGMSKKDETQMVNAIFVEGPRELPMLMNRSPEVPAEGTKIISKCLNADKEQRYQNAQELLKDINDMFVQLETGASPKSAQDRKPFRDWSVNEVFDLIQSIGPAYGNAAAAMKDLGLDGKFFLSMLESDDEDLTASIDDGGLGFKRLQLKALKAKVEEVK